MSIHQKLIDKFGEHHQKLKAIEEMAELTQSIIKGTNIAEEIADVQIMLDQMKIIYPDWITWQQIKVIRIQNQVL